jgi:hypothetical protein
MNTKPILDNNLGSQLRRADGARLKKLLLFSLPPLVWMLFILALIGLPGYRFPSTEVFSSDKFIHFGLFFVLSLLLMQAFVKQPALPMLKFKAGYYTLLTGILYSGLTEMLQGLIFIQRSADLMDYLANASGVLVGWLFFKYIIHP